MPKKSYNREEKVRLTLSVNKSVKDRLELLCELTGAESLTEVIRRSLLVYEHLWSEAEEKGKKIVLRSNEGKEEAIIFK